MNWKTYLKKKGARVGAIVVAVVLVLALIAGALGGKAEAFTVSTDVYFRPCTEEELRAYIATGEPMDKAGAYGVQSLGALLVERIDGDFYNVMGLPVEKLGQCLTKHFGVRFF